LTNCGVHLKEFSRRDPESLGQSALALLEDFSLESEARRASWRVVQAEKMNALRDHIAIAHGYACATANDYVFPAADIIGRLTPDQFRQFNGYLSYVSEHALIPVCKMARLARRRQLNDLAKGHFEADLGPLRHYKEPIPS
jgi:hypothetical protein